MPPSVPFPPHRVSCHAWAKSNNSGSTWQNYEICNYDQLGVVDLSFLRTRGACPRCGLARVQRTTEGVGRLWGSPSPDIVEEGACPRPYALVYGPSVISSTERVLVLCLFAVSVWSHISAFAQSDLLHRVRDQLLKVTNLFSVYCWPPQVSRDVLCVSCVRRLLGGGEAEDISLFHYGRHASLLPPPSMVRLDRLYHVPSLQPPFRTFASQCTLYPHLTPIRSAHLAYISSIPLTQSLSHSTVATWLKASTSSEQL